MRIAFITRSTFYKVPGGDTIQIGQIVKHLKKSGIDARIFLTNEQIDYTWWDLFHFSNITRPADILFHITRTPKPFILSPILIDYSEYDKHYRKGLSGFLLRQFPAGSNEYIKTLARWISGKDKLQSKPYLWKGQQQSIREILKKVAGILPNSEKEYQKLRKLYSIEKEHAIVPNGIDTTLFRPDEKTPKNTRLVLCAARIEGLKNQLNLIKALNNTEYTLMIVGAAAPNQKRYYDQCRKIAAQNIVFHEQVPQVQLAEYYKTAKVHALPSWFETCGLSSLEAAAMGCNIVITEKGFAREYFGNDAFYCDPADPVSIFKAIEKAAKRGTNKELQQKITEQYTWQNAAAITLKACKNIISA